MPMMTNNTSQSLEFIVSGKNEDGSAKTEGLRRGETKNIKANMDDVRTRAFINSGAVTVGEAPVAQPAAAKGGK